MRVRSFILAILALLAVGLAGLWLSVTVSVAPLQNPVARWLPWPVACTTRGCITTWQWQAQWTLKQTFAAKTSSDAGNANQALTTLIRQHLVHFATVKSNVTDRDAVRYREDILNVKSAERVREMTNLTVNAYDQRAIKPFLEQENLMQERKLSAPAELFKQLAAERFVLMLPFRLRWNREQGSVEP